MISKKHLRLLLTTASFVFMTNKVISSENNPDQYTIQENNYVSQYYKAYLLPAIQRYFLNNDLQLGPLWYDYDALKASGFAQNMGEDFYNPQALLKRSGFDLNILNGLPAYNPPRNVSLEVEDYYKTYLLPAIQRHFLANGLELGHLWYDYDALKASGFAQNMGEDFYNPQALLKRSGFDLNILNGLPSLNAFAREEDDIEYLKGILASLNINIPKEEENDIEYLKALALSIRDEKASEHISPETLAKKKEEVLLAKQMEEQRISLKSRQSHQVMGVLTAMKNEGIINDAELLTLKTYITGSEISEIDRSLQNYTKVLKTHKIKQVMNILTVMKNEGIIDDETLLNLKSHVASSEISEIDRSLQNYTEILKTHKLKETVDPINDLPASAPAETQAIVQDINVFSPVMSRPLSQPKAARPLPQPNKAQSNQILEEKKESISSNPILPAVPVSEVVQEDPKKDIPNAPGKMVVGAKNIPNAPKSPVKVAKKVITSDVSIADQIANIARDRAAVNTEELEKKVQENKALSKQNNQNGIVENSVLDAMKKKALKLEEDQAQNDINEAKVEDDEWGDDDDLVVQPSVQKQEQPTKVVQEASADVPVIDNRSQAQILADLEEKRLQGDLLRNRLTIMSKDIHKKDKDDDWDD